MGASRAEVLARCIENKGSLSYHMVLSTSSYVQKNERRKKQLLERTYTKQHTIYVLITQQQEANDKTHNMVVRLADPVRNIGKGTS